MKKSKKTVIISASILAVVLSVAFFYAKDSKRDDSGNIQSSKIKAVVYKSPTCGCCVQYVSYLEKQGFEVETVTTKDTASVKDKYKIKSDMESCHTAVIGDYFIEGHIPIEAVRKLLEEKPGIDGIALPEMPSGSPGMPGPKLGPFEIFSLKDGATSDFMNL